MKLEIMIDAGDALANRLQGLAEKSRTAYINDGVLEGDLPAVKPKTKAEKELLEAVKAKKKS